MCGDKVACQAVLLQGYVRARTKRIIDSAYTFQSRLQRKGQRTYPVVGLNPLKVHDVESVAIHAHLHLRVNSKRKNTQCQAWPHQ